MRNTSQIGEISRTQVIAALALQGKRILLPLGDHQRYDLVVEDEGVFLRVQCKTGRLIRGAIIFNPCSIDSRSKQGGCIRKEYSAEEIDLFGVYCPDNHHCYLVPVTEATRTGCSLRIDPPRNGQKTRIRWAQAYEIRGVEPTGIEPVTSTMPLSRAPNCATAPVGSQQDIT
jgi:hypothetical protein